MDQNTVLVLAGPGEPQLSMLKELKPEARVAIGNSADDFEQTAADATVVFHWSSPAPVLRGVLGMCPRLKWVHLRSAGMEDLLFPELIASPAILTNGRGVFSAPLGEFALGAILHFAKDFRRLIRNQEAGVWSPFDVLAVEGRTVGIIGYGDIGRAVASRVRAMGMRVLALKRHAPSPGETDHLVDRVYTPDQRLEMIALCDYLVICAPLTPETRGLISNREFAAMQPEAVVINVGRGPVIDEAAMLRALSGGRIKGAALDVFETEPLPSGHPFYKLENVLLSPHSADHTADWLAKAMRFFLDQFERFRKGEPLKNVVEKTRGY